MDETYYSEIERLYLLMYDKLFVYARSSLFSDALAEEAVQETFRIACGKPEALCSSENPEGWLVATLKYVLSNSVRSRKAACRVLTDYVSARIETTAAPEKPLPFSVLYEDIAQTEEFQILRELVIDRASLLEIAQARGISLDACKKRIQRAKKVLRKKLKE